MSSRRFRCAADFSPAADQPSHQLLPGRRGEEDELRVRPGAGPGGRPEDPGATRQLLGVSDRRYQETIAEALVGLGCERAMVVCSDDGVDEISSAAALG